jgi:inner membrane transporter RhtA
VATFTDLFPPWLLVVIAILSIQIGAGIAKGLFDTAGPAGVVFLRTLFGGLIFVALWRPRVRGYRPRDYALVAICAATIATMMLTFYAAIDRIPLGVAVAIAFVGPLGVSVAMSRRAVDLAWVALAGIGILLLSPLTNADLDPVGVLLMLISALGWAVFILISRPVGRTFRHHDGLALSMCLAAVFVAPFGAAGALNVLRDPALLPLGIVVGLLSSAIPFALEFAALQKLPARAYGLLISLEPVIAALVGLVALQEGLEPRVVVGILLVTLAAAANARSGQA